MADIKKEHYVPRCDLKNFAMDNSMIWVFDKYKTQCRNQKNYGNSNGKLFL